MLKLKSQWLSHLKGCKICNWLITEKNGCTRCQAWWQWKPFLQSLVWPDRESNPQPHSHLVTTSQGRVGKFHCDYCSKYNTKIIKHKKYITVLLLLCKSCSNFRHPSTAASVRCIWAFPSFSSFFFCVKIKEGAQEQLCGAFNFTFWFASRHLCCVPLPNSSDLRRLGTRSSVFCSVFAVTFGETKRNPKTGWTHYTDPLPIMRGGFGLRQDMKGGRP